jgi:hypothetical protein
VPRVARYFRHVALRAKPLVCRVARGVLAGGAIARGGHGLTLLRLGPPAGPVLEFEFLLRLTYSHTVHIPRIAGVVLTGAISSCALFTDLDGLDGDAPPASSNDGTPNGDDDDGAERADGGASRDAVADQAVDHAVDQAASCTLRPVGMACNTSAECCSSNCFNFKCEGNQVGAGCERDDNCVSANCFNFRCEGNEIGAACKRDDQCVTANCFNFRCEGNQPGASCEINANCTSKVCFSFRCQ